MASSTTIPKTRINPNRLNILIETSICDAGINISVPRKQTGKPTITQKASFTLKNSEKDESEVPYMTTSLKADKVVKMGIITDIKQELRQVNALKLSYTASKSAE